MSFQSAIHVSHVTFTYRDAVRPAVKDVSFDVQKGSWTALIGHNGSGKSTISRLLNGLLFPDRTPEHPAQITVAGIDLTAQTLWQVRDEVGIVFQNPDNQFVGATVADDVAFGLENRAVPRPEMIKRVDQALEDVGMSDFKRAEPSHLSGGQKQRVAIAGILALSPQIIILDEATSMLDPDGRQQILTLIKAIQKKTGLTVLSITHDLNEASLADQILVLHDGKLLEQGKPREVFRQTSLMKKIGLDIPFVAQVKAELIKKGVSIPDEVESEQELVNYLWQLNSNM